MITAKPCRRCGEEKSLESFPRDPKCRDGHRHVCKVCAESDNGAWRAKHREKKRASQLAYYQRNKARYQHVLKEYAKTHPLERAAHTAVRLAIKCGRITRQPCENCGNVRTQAHHDDYEKPLDIRWLCTSCHKKHHYKLAAEGRDPDFGRKRTR